MKDSGKRAKERLVTMKKLAKPIYVQENRITMVEAAGRFQRFAQAIRKVTEVGK